MQRITAVCLVAISLTFCGLSFARPQEETKPASEENKTTKVERPVKPVHAYRVDFSISELEGGKKINTRHYLMDLNSGPWSQIKIGTRVPVSPTQGSFQYIDLGTSIDCELEEQGVSLVLDVRSDFSNLSSPEEHSSQPIIRQIKINGRTITEAGKAVLIGAVDDPNSSRQFQLEATVTSVK
jgi:hypothetical protein